MKEINKPEWEKEFDALKERAEYISSDNTWHIFYKIILPFIREQIAKTREQAYKDGYKARTIEEVKMIDKRAVEGLEKGEFEEVLEKRDEKKRQELLNKIDALIAEEMLICHKEGQPTSRLTGLATRISKLRDKK